MPGFVRQVQGGPLTGLAIREVPGVLEAVLRQIPTDTPLDAQKLYELLRATGVSAYMSGLVNGLALGMMDPHEAANLAALDGIDEAMLNTMQEAHRAYLDEIRQAVRAHLERGEHSDAGSPNGVLADEAGTDAGRA